jgi:ABC-2 type transport system permease protein
MTVITLLCLGLSLFLSVYQFSKDNIDNILSKRGELSVSSDKMEFLGWKKTETGYHSVTEDPMILLHLESPSYVHNLRIDGSLNRKLSTVTVYYQEGTEETKTMEVPVEVKNKDTYVKIEKNVSRIGLKLCNEVGCDLSLSSVVINPKGVNVNFQLLVLSFLCPFVLAWLGLELIDDSDSFKKTFSSLKSYRCLLYDLVSRDIKTKYRRSVLGILWSVLNPLLMMLVLTAVFANIFRYDITDFPVYYLTGYILFNFVSEATSFSMTSIINAAGLIKKVYIPKVLFPLEKCLFSLVNLAFSLIAAVIVFLIVGVTPSWTMLLFFVPIVYLFIFCFGLSLILATMNTFFRDVGYLYGVFITLWVYLTPIIYPINILPAWMQSIVRMNPLTHYVEYFRSVTLYGTLPSLGENLVCIAYSLTFLLIGIMVFQKKQNKFIFYI